MANVKFIKLSLMAVSLVPALLLAEPQVQSHSSPEFPFSSIYGELSLPYVSSNWSNYPYDGTEQATFSSNGEGGFSFGGGVGVEFIPYLGMELDAFHLPEATYSSNGGGTLSSWLLDLTGRISVPIFLNTNTELYVKAGVGYRSIEDSGSEYGDVSYTGPIFGAGLSYDVIKGVFLGAEYVRVPMNTQSEGAPAANMFMLNIGYKYSS